MSLPASYFEALYAEREDPWDFATSAYEDEKYARTVAALRGRRFGRALEVGCSIGVLTARLAGSCDTLVALEPVARAREAARARTAGLPGVQVRDGALPDDVPPGPWDLVVCSEVLYYLDAGALARALDGLEADLVAGGVLLAVHWTPATRTYPLQGEAVHEALLARPALAPLAEDRGPTWRLDLLERHA